MWQLLVGVIPLALAAAITPTLIATQLLVVAEGERWRARALAVIAANTIAFGIVSALVLLGFARLPDAGTGGGGPIDTAIRAVAGAILVLVSLWFLWPHPGLAARTQASLERRLEHASVWVFFAVAFYFSITDLSSFVVLLPALHDVTSSTVDVVAKAIVMAVVLMLALQGTIAPALLRVVGGRRVLPGLQRTYAWVMGRQFAIVGVVCLAVGVYLIATALLHR